MTIFYSDIENISKYWLECYTLFLLLLELFVKTLDQHILCNGSRLRNFIAQNCQSCGLTLQGRSNRVKKLSLMLDEVQQIYFALSVISRSWRQQTNNLPDTDKSSCLLFAHGRLVIICILLVCWRELLGD